MGNWYTNICVKDRQQSHVIDALDELGRRAYVTPDTGGWIIRYDQECEKFDLDLLQSPALTISTRLSCIALASCNADDDILWLGVYEDGKRPLGILLNENILQMPASFRQFRTFEACSAESSRKLKKGRRFTRYSADLMAY